MRKSQEKWKKSRRKKKKEGDRLDGNHTERVTIRISQKKCLKGVFAKNERGYRLNAIKQRF